MRLDTSAATDTPEPVQAGTFHVYVAKASEYEKRYEDGSETFKAMSLQLREIGSERFICFDMVAMNGKGAGIGKSKLHGLDFDTDEVGEYLPEMFQGRRAWVSTKLKTWKGETKAEVDIRKGEHCGYWTEAEYEQAYPEAPSHLAGDADTDTPF